MITFIIFRISPLVGLGSTPNDEKNYFICWKSDRGGRILSTLTVNKKILLCILISKTNIHLLCY